MSTKMKNQPFKDPSEVGIYGHDYYLYVMKELKEHNKTFDRRTAWVDKILSEPHKYFEIVVRFAEEAQKRLGRKKHD